MDERVLVVDDDSSMLRMLEKDLTAAGYEVLSAANGMEALRIIHAEGPQIIVADWVMPVMDGLELCRAIRASEGVGFVYIIMVTARTNKESVLEAFDAGADDFLGKPFHRQELLARLKAGARIVALEVDLAKRTREIHKANAELAVLNRRLERMAATDELTGLANRREAMARLAEHWATAERYHQPYACALLDLDEFKCFNDTCGHNVGDLVLREVSGTLIANSRNGDTISRFGGEEFLVLCPNTTAELALETAQDLRRAVQATKIQWRDRELTVTLSAGVAERDATTRTLYDLLNKADAALYAAKDAGRNRVCVAGPETAGAASRKEPSGLPWVPA